MSCSGEGGKGRDHRTSFHAAMKIFRNEGIFGMYNGLASSTLCRHAWFRLLSKFNRFSIGCQLVCCVKLPTAQQG